jgi:single-strand DNA-binding protein
MANLNKIFLMGNLTRDPQLTYTPTQTAVVDFGLAVNRRWRGKDGSNKEETCFVDCRAFGRQAENINKYLTKGRPLLVEGRLTFNSWTAQDGSKRSKHRVTVEQFQFIGGPAGGQAAGQAAGAEAAEPAYEEQQDADAQQQNSNAAGSDDIPF